MSAGALAETLRLHPSTLTGILQRLEGRGLVRRAVDPQDRRRSRLELTRAGRRLDVPTPHTVEAVVGRVLARYSKARIRSAAEILEAVAAGLLEATARTDEADRGAAATPLPGGIDRAATTPYNLAAREIPMAEPNARDPESVRLEEDRDAEERTGSAGGRTSPSASGAPCARTTAPTATPGRTFPHDAAPLARLPLGRGRPRRHLRPPRSASASRSRSGTASDPILKERLFGLTGPEGNHGEDVKEYYFYLDSTPTHSYMRMLYKYPQAEFPYAQLRRGERPPRQATSRSTSCSTRASSTTTATSTSSSSTRRPSPEDILVRDRRSRTAGPRPRPCTSCRRSGSATPGRGAWTPRRPRVRRADGPPGAASDLDHAPRATATARSYAEGAPRAALHRERDERRAPLRQRRTTAPYVKDAFHDCVVHGDDGGREPRRSAGRRPPRSTGSTCRRAARRRSACASTDASIADAVRRRRSTRSSPRARAEADEFYADVIPTRRLGRREERHAPGVRRAALEQAVLPLRRRALAEGRPGRSRRRPPSASTAATTSGRTSTTPTSSRCPTSGSTPGTRRGTSRSTACRSRSSTPTSPSSSSSCSCASGTCTRTGSSRRTSGSSAT